MPRRTISRRSSSRAWAITSRPSASAAITASRSVEGPPRRCRCAAFPATTATRRRAMSRRRSAISASPRSICPTAIRSAPTNIATSSPGCSGSRRRPGALLESERACVLAGDYNICPTDDDVYDPVGWRERRAVPARIARALSRAAQYGPRRRLPRPPPRAASLQFLGLPGRALDARRGPAHRPPAAVAAGRRPACREPTSTRRRAARDKASDHTPVWCEIGAPA